MLCGFMPFVSENITELLESIVQVNVTYPKHLSQNAKDLLQSILTANPKKRLTADEIKKHPWFLEKMTSQEKADLEEDNKKIAEVLENQTNTPPIIDFGEVEDISPRTHTALSQQINGSSAS
mmetsp:Transcript_30432/g.27672  ORF Transcript_30432/g.27672 Transcript_30432/m.27672 type:complete len:122 (+) Transcript_30432:689-1054(+)